MRITKASPLLIEFEYGTVRRPLDLGLSEDIRSLAVYYRSVKITCDVTGQTVAEFELGGELPRGFHPIFGLNKVEEFGVWSAGRRTCFLLDLSASPAGPCSISIGHDILGQSPIEARVWVNAHPLETLSFGGGSVTFSVPSGCQFGAITAAASKNLSLEPEAHVDVTIIILNYGLCALTIGCLIWLLASETGSSYELIVVDNGSDAAGYAALQRADLPIQLLRLEQRRSFGEANNLAAEQGRGSKLLFLNNDAFVRPPCLDALVNALADEAVGAAGPIFNDAEGRLQEAGSFISLDGGVVLWDYRFSGPGNEFPKLSAVDHISAACLMVRRNDFMQLGGFDPVYDPAYHEDVDLCCKIRAAGKSVQLVPEAQTIHIRNATVATLPSSDPVFVAQERNTLIFRSRWAAWLATNPQPSVGAGAAAAAEAVTRTAQTDLRQPVNALLFTGVLQGGYDAFAAIATSCALSDLRPTLFCTPTAYSRLRFTHYASEFSLQVRPVSMGTERSLDGRNVKLLVHTTCEMPPPPCSHGERRILHCPMPREAKGLSESERAKRITALSRYGLVVTNSEFGRRRVLLALRRLGVPGLRVVVIRLPFGCAKASAESSPDNLILSVGPYRERKGGGSHDQALIAFQQFTGSRSDPQWRLVCLGEVHSPDDLLYFKDLSFRAAAWKGSCLISPSRQQRVDLFRRAKICVSANEGIAEGNEGMIGLTSLLNLRDATEHGCIPIAYRGTAEADMCKELGFDFIIDDPRQVEKQVRRAATAGAWHEAPGPARAMLDTLSMSTFSENWRHLLEVNSI
jgi:GT2 family glycosyltransferase